MKKIEWKIEKRKVKKLTPADYNPRLLSDKQREDLEASIKEFGQAVPIVINTTGTIIGGHQRAVIYADLGIEETDVMVPDRKLTPAEEKRLNLRLNKNQGSWDYEKLKDFELDTLLGVGFGDEELSAMWDDVTDLEDDGFDIKKAIRQIGTPKTKEGDIYELGEHRLMCGDRLSPHHMELLMAGQKADMVYCDPPYNIGLDYSEGLGASYNTAQSYGGKYKKKDDSKTPEKYSAFLKKTIENALAHAKDDVHIFYWCDENYIWLMQSIFREVGFSLRRVCLWIKNNANLTPQFAFNKVYEACVYATRGKPFLNRAYTKFHEILNKEIGTGNQVYAEIMEIINLWFIPRDTDYKHPTQKPLTLHEKPMKRCTKPADIILDLFGGSGSTLIAAEQLKRKCFMMEIDPIFVEVIIARWEEYTGRKAKKL